jgi:hypothetical protein
MSLSFRLGVIVALAGASYLPAPVFAAAPEEIDPAANARAAPAVIAPLEYELGTELVVRDWVLCVSQTYAETIARAHAEGAEQALAAYADLKAAKSCGQFPEMHVILDAAVHLSDSSVVSDAQVFSASVNIGGKWAKAFVIQGSLPPPSP